MCSITVSSITVILGFMVLLYVLLLFCFNFCFLHYELHIPVCHILRVVDPHHVAPRKELVTVTVQADLDLC